jgi:ferritin-like metal-binding protein YciE
VEQPIYIRHIIIILSCNSILVVILIIFAGFVHHMRSFNISRRLENTLQRNIQTVNTNSINEQVETKINELKQDIQGINRILKVQERQINCVEYEVFEFTNKRSHHRSLSSTSVNSGSNIEFKTSSTVINDNNIGSIFFLDPHV